MSNDTTSAMITTPPNLNPLMTPLNMFGGFEGSGFLFPMGVPQMGFQCNETQGFSMLPQMLEVPKKKPIILDQTQERYTGKLKFFDEVKGYGFIVNDEDDKDIFCHFDDFCKAGITINMLRSVKMGQLLKLSFSCLNYIGRHNKSKKAVELQLISLEPAPMNLPFPGPPMTLDFMMGMPPM